MNLVCMFIKKGIFYRILLFSCLILLCYIIIIIIIIDVDDVISLFFELDFVVVSSFVDEHECWNLIQIYVVEVMLV